MSSSVFIESSSLPKTTASRSSDGADFESEAGRTNAAASADSNLVLVYGKNGINFDQRGLEKLIEEKTLSSISVIRLSSPTPSMEDEEEAEEKQKELLRRQEEGFGSDDDSEFSEKNSTNKDDDDEEQQNDTDASDEELEDSTEEDAEEDAREKSNNDAGEAAAAASTNEDDSSRVKSKKKANATKVQKQLKRRRKKARPEIVGLTVEQFYPQEDANELIKEVLKLSGRCSTVKDSTGPSAIKEANTDYKLQLYVIMNDHCYTPYTSPEQMKAKLDAEKQEAEKQAVARKAATPAQIMITAAGASKKKPLFKLSSQTAEAATDKPFQTQSKDKPKRTNNSDELINDANEVDERQHSSSVSVDDDSEADDVESDYSISSEESAETDNDRDSDLDFDVNNRKGRKRKDASKAKQLLKKTSKQRLSLPTASYAKRRQHSQENSDDATAARKAAVNKNSGDSASGRGHNKSLPPPPPAKAGAANLSASVICMPKQLSAAIAALPPIPKKQPQLPLPSSTSATITFGGGEVKASTVGGSISSKPSPSTATSTSMPTNMRRGPIVQIGSPTPCTPANLAAAIHRSAQLQKSPQTVKEIVISKVLASPKGGFTDISALLTQSDHQSITTLMAPITPTSTATRSHPHLASQITTTPSSKGFTPLGIEAAVKNQLPAQISIQTHQSSSELAAEHDKQLDLIDSIVQDEMQKAGGNIMEKVASVNQNIPELVKMLESTEKALVESSSNKTQTPEVKTIATAASVAVTVANYTPSAAVENVDISNAPLLEPPEEVDDIPDDLLQHVVDLIEDDKTLQEAVEKQVFGEDSSETVGGSGGGGVGIVATTTPPPLAPIFQQHQQPKAIINVLPQPNPQETPAARSIIQMTISNSPISVASAAGISSSASVAAPSPSPSSFRLAGIHTPKTLPLVRKEPIQIVRGNGRVITLPPIEAPTTRAKRRAQALPTTTLSSDSNVQINTSFASSTLNESSMDNSLQSNASFSGVVLADTSSSNIGSVLERKLSDTSGRRRVSKEGAAAVTTIKVTKKAAAISARKASSAAAKASFGKNNEPTEAEISQEDDDDPNKLWCICRQPHKNRFMICCDECEDWFHGTCVNVTKAMGKEMESKGIDWKCPKCLKKQEEKTQLKITDMLLAKKTPSTSATTSAAASTLQPQNASPCATPDAMATPTYFEGIAATTTTNIAMTSPLVAETAKTELERAAVTPLPKKQIIEIKKIQTGQFIPLKNLDQSKKTPITVVTSGQKKMFPATPLPSSANTSSKRVIVQNVQDSRALLFNRNATAATASGLEKSSQPPAHARVQRVNAQPARPTTPCIMCKKPARPNSIYCGDDCIRKHAQNALNAFAASSAKTPELVPINPTQAKTAAEEKKKKAKGLFEDLLSMADRKPRAERVNVFERKSGRVLTGNAAPTTLNLKKWLQDNPTFEVVQPGSVQAIEIEKKQKQRALQASALTASKGYAPPPLFPTSSSSSILTMAPQSPTKSAPHTLMNQKFDGNHLSQQQQTQLEVTTTTSLQSKNIKQLLEQAKSSSPTASRPNTPKQLQKYPQQVTIKPAEAKHLKQSEVELKTKEKTTTLKRQGSEINSGGAKKFCDIVSSGQTDSEPIRLNVRRTLKDQLLQRIEEQASTETEAAVASNVTDSQIPKLNASEVEEFVVETEAEMYNYFNRDTGTKYKSKYRSLMFNIKDRKNHTLFAKISAKLITAKQLVRMSPEELASQELAQWRENEAKHQLEMIKKSELDLLSCAKNYVLKTHKGEEVIEAKQTDCVNLDITIPVEDVVSVLNNATAGELELELATANSVPASSGRKDYGHLSDFGSAGGTSLGSPLSSSLYHHQLESSTSYRALSPPLIEDKLSKSFSKERDREKEREREKRHKSNIDRHRSDKARTRKTRSRSRSRSRSREKRHHRSGSRKDEQRRDRDRDRGGEDRTDRGGEKDRNKDRDNHETTDKRNAATAEKKAIVAAPSSSLTKMSSSTKEKTINAVGKKLAKPPPPPLETFSLIDQILESSKTVEEAANLVSSSEKEKEKEKDKTQIEQYTPITTTLSTTPQLQTQPSNQTNTQQTIETVLALSTAAAAHSPPPPPPPPPPQSLTTLSFSTTDSDLKQSNKSTNPISSTVLSTTSALASSTDSFSTSSSLDPYTRYNSSGANGESASAIWGGNINMIDVASFQIILQSVVGNSLNLGKLLPDELDVVGRIGPDTVWDYISKIMKSPNKEIVIIRLLPSSESETAAYTILYQYLDKRKRLGVIKTTSGQIKDFYIFPLGAGRRNMPAILQPVERVDFYEDPLRPDMLIGIVIRVIGKRSATAAASSAVSSSSSSAAPNTSSTTNTASAAKFSRRVTEVISDSLTPPGSPKRNKKRPHSALEKDDEIDLDAIIKAPIAAKSNKALTVAPATSITIPDDANEPYSPGGSSDDDVPLMPLKASTIMDAHKTTENELKRKMDELNRQIAAQEMEIAGLLNVEPSRYAPSSSSTVLANISIPSNLSQILASIKSKPEQPPMPTQAPPPTSAPPPPLIGSLTQANSDADEEYNPEDAIGMSYEKMKVPEKSSSSRLAQLSEAELLSMVPDNMIEETTSISSAEKKIRYEQPPPPGV